MLSRERWTDQRKSQFRKMWDAGEKPKVIAAALRTSVGAVYVQRANLGLTPRREYRSGKRAVSTVHRAEHGKRRFAGIEPTGESRIRLPEHHPAFRDGATIFPHSVIPASKLPRLLKGGENSRKIGGLVTKGHLRGSPIFTLTLEERHTCPRSCKVWDSCYGNNMNWAQRIADDGTLQIRLWGELASINAQHPGGFLVRLHVLGDFIDLAYVEFWAKAMRDFPALTVFGFTAHDPQSSVGRAIALMLKEYGPRWSIRFSGFVDPENGSEVVEAKADAIGILCPAQSDEERCCASCALCWQSNRTISFLRH